MQTFYRSYDDIYVGELLPRVAEHFFVDAERVAAFRSATMPVEIRASLADAPGNEAEVPSMIAAIYLVNVMHSRRAPPGGLHAKQNFRFHRRLRLGETLSIQGRVTEKYERKGRPYVVISLEVKSEGEMVAEATITSVWGQDT